MRVCQGRGRPRSHSLRVVAGDLPEPAQAPELASSLAGVPIRSSEVATTRMSRLIGAPRERVYDALLDPEAVARWKVPAGMRCEVHEFEPVEGGAIRISLTYDARDRSGKTRGRTDTYRGRFVRLIPNELVVEADEFETDDPALRGEMVITIALSDRTVRRR